MLSFISNLNGATEIMWLSTKLCKLCAKAAWLAKGKKQDNSIQMTQSKIKSI